MKSSHSASEHLHPPDDAFCRKQFVIEAFDRYERQLTAYALRILGGSSGNLHAARDAVQFTFLKLCQQSPIKIADKIAPWLYTVCRNRVIDELRTRKKQPQLDGIPQDRIDSSITDPSEQMEIDDFLDRLPDLLRTLSDKEREAIELWAQGLKPSEIAAVIDKPAGNVRVSLHRGIKKLQQHPEVSQWLERATGQGERESSELLNYRPALNGRAFKTTSTTGNENE